jgi:hypothetical protein
MRVLLKPHFAAMQKLAVLTHDSSAKLAMCWMQQPFIS